ncbi:MAG: DUF4330 domain-containing protein [Woronichinia naegeliana WA131]|jgi:hypothetical protein|uniref:DUF4330 domain-containing protein n=1 Tax=Woronichinia naegeliana WA131 TaxID=2824559 RepID=A0A977KS96_9CYAN|nr:MAG: DUF4330 domain-containing protein [Woronichinia naegeliana WA131]
MKLLDAKGRVFGKISILDLGAALILFMVIVGIFVIPGTSGKSIVAQVQTKPIEVDTIVRGLNVLKPESLIQEFKLDNKTNIIIRNQPAGQVEILKVQELPRNLAVPQPDGSVKALPDPRPEGNFSQDMILTLGGNAEMTPTGVVLGNQKIKIGTVLELEGKSYDFNASVIDIRIKS